MRLRCPMRRPQSAFKLAWCASVDDDRSCLPPCRPLGSQAQGDDFDPTAAIDTSAAATRRSPTPPRTRACGLCQLTRRGAGFGRADRAVRPYRPRSARCRTHCNASRNSTGTVTWTWKALVVDFEHRSAGPRRRSVRGDRRPRGNLQARRAPRGRDPRLRTSDHPPDGRRCPARARTHAPGSRRHRRGAPTLRERTRPSEAPRRSRAADPVNSPHALRREGLGRGEAVMSSPARALEPSSSAVSWRVSCTRGVSTRARRWSSGPSWRRRRGTTGREHPRSRIGAGRWRSDAREPRQRSRR